MEGQLIPTDEDYNNAIETIERIVNKVVGIEVKQDTRQDVAFIAIANTLKQLEEAVLNGSKED